jgi:C-terminal processing protease CtpA/Prc
MKIRITLIFGFMALALTLSADFRQVEGGIGITIADRKHEKEPTRVAQVFRGSPAERAGIKTNWFIISVDRTNVVSMSSLQCMLRVCGLVGTSVVLELADPPMQHTNKFTVKREKGKPEDRLPRSFLFAR